MNMKKRVSNISLSIILAFLFAGISASVYGQTAEKEIAESYSISKGFTLGVDNSYGEINIVNWDKNELSVVVTIKTEASRQEWADKLLDDVNIEIDEGSENVFFETEIDKKNMNGKNKIRVIYDIKTPSYMNVDLKQTYGNVYIQDITGKANLEIQYGDLTANFLEVESAGEWNSLELKYGNATIEYLGKLLAEVRYSGLNVSEAKELSLESSYSKLNLGEINKAEIESKYDKVAIDRLNGLLEIESGYTQLSIGKISANFTGIYAEMTYGNLKGGLEAGTSFEIDAETSYGSINIPEGEYDFEKDGSRQYAEGRVGSKGKARVEVSIKYGNLKLE